MGRPVIPVAAFTTMISTTLSVSDGFLVLLALGGLAVIHEFTANLRALVDVARPSASWWRRSWRP